MGLADPPARIGMGAGTCRTLVTPTRGVDIGAEVSCVLVGLTSGTGMGGRADRKPATPMQGVGTGV